MTGNDTSGWRENSNLTCAKSNGASCGEMRDIIRDVRLGNT